jgi:hypothetical protein
VCERVEIKGFLDLSVPRRRASRTPRGTVVVEELRCMFKPMT